jgi:hypothetical protein
MALAKLWNAVFGKRASTEETAGATTAPPASGPLRTLSPAAAKSGPGTGAPAPTPEIKLSRKKTKTSRQKLKKEPELLPQVEPAPVLKLFRKKNNAWTKLIGNRVITSVLDTHVGDGSRAVEVLESIVDGSQPSPKYIAIGMFDLNGQGLTLRQFHQKTRAVGGQPIAVPMTLVEGLRRLTETIGTVDLVLWDGDEQSLTDPVVAKLLSRISSKGALVLRSDANGRWQTLNQSSLVPSRRAA